MNHYEELVLVQPSPEFNAEYAAVVREFLQTDQAWFNNFELALSDFPAFVHELEDADTRKEMKYQHLFIGIYAQYRTCANVNRSSLTYYYHRTDLSERLCLH